MGSTKQGTQYEIVIPSGLVEILRWHISMLPSWHRGDSELLFPGRFGLLAPTMLTPVFNRIVELAGIKKHITPRAMRRSFQDLARTAQVDHFVTRSISGHSGEDMQRLYSTIYGEEQREGMARIVSLAGFREAHAKVHSPVHESGCIETPEESASK
jgi:integrase